MLARLTRPTFAMGVVGLGTRLTMFCLLAACILLLLLFVCWYKYAYAPYQLFKRIGIPHPPVTPFVGNGLQLLSEDTSVMTLSKWIKTYGKITGYYIGSTPNIVVADLDMIKEITVKQFDKFTDSMVEPDFSIAMREQLNCGAGLIFRKGNDWKCVRHIVSPTFSTKKLKLMTSLVEKSCNSLIDRMEEISSSGQSDVDFCKLFDQFTMASILAVAFGSQVNILKGEASSLTDAAKGLFGEFTDSSIVWSEVISSQLPIVVKGLSLIAKMFPAFKRFQSFIEITQNIVQTRRQQMQLETETRNDFIHLLMNAHAEEDSSSKKLLTDEDITGLCVDFMVAGYETTSNLLSFTSYLLALNPDKQELLCEAISNYYQENEDATLYDASQGISYLDWVIQESLRLYPPVPKTTRTCTETCTINGIIFHKGIVINFPTYYNHRSSEYWDEPDVFEPNRFSPEGKEGRNPLCHHPFGWGPRTCLGMRFALMEAKMALVSILKSYKFERGPDTQVPLRLKSGITQLPRDGVFLNVIKY